MWLWVYFLYGGGWAVNCTYAYEGAGSQVI